MAEYISRTDAESIMAMLVMEVSARPKDFTCGEAVKAIRSIPAADVAPVVHGYWMSTGSKRDRFCSVCYGDEPYKFADVDADVYDYCPRCGARMDYAKQDHAVPHGYVDGDAE